MIRVDQCRWEEVFVYVDTAIVAKGQRPIYGWVQNRTPEVYDLEAAPKELESLIGRKMFVDSGDTRCRSPIHVNVRYRLTCLLAVDYARMSATDSW